MFLKHMKEARTYETEIPENPFVNVHTEGLCYNPRWWEFDTSNRDQWAYVGLDDKEFEGKKKILDEWKEAVAKEDVSYVATHCLEGWCDCGCRAFFEVYENDEYDSKPIAYLLITNSRGPYENSDCCERAMALADEVKDWEPGKIQALLLNRLNHWRYVKDDTRDFIPFDDDHGSRRIKASCENDGFEVYKTGRVAKMSKMERDKYINVF